MYILEDNKHTFYTSNQLNFSLVMNVRIKLCVKVWGFITEFKSNLYASVSKMYSNMSIAAKIYLTKTYNKFGTPILSRSRVERERS